MAKNATGTGIECFFHFFKPPPVAGHEFHMQEDDYEIGLTIRDKITGEAEEDDSIYMEFDMEAYEDACLMECGISRHVKGRHYIEEDYDDMYMECDISRHVKGRDNIEEEDEDEDEAEDDDDDDDDDDDEDEYAGHYDREEEEEDDEEKPEKETFVSPASTKCRCSIGVQWREEMVWQQPQLLVAPPSHIQGQVISVRDISTRRSLGYGFVNYSNPQYAAKAMEMLDFTPVNGKSIRGKHSHRDPNFPKSRTSNLFVRNLDRSIDSKILHDTFSSFGSIRSCKVDFDFNGQSKCYGFVHFDNDESAQSAIDKLNGALINDRQVYVAHALRKEKSGRAQAG
ncbi:hypothetical protein K7X08_004503 [Anisodus acutangulus]|uniref:RRM domain-containing protein n=1 Tax=Anisodus acutangulus TaxID=402998 RepID=A0A9Q1MDI3_9SOLA|nr:hypothetical protein K7X08_004503 [Anisodus acutangulus]